MNKATFYGRIVEVSEPKDFVKNDTTYSYRTVLFHIADPEVGYAPVPGNYIATNLWENINIPELGVLARFTVRLSSERNRKDPNIFFHKVNLQSVEVV